MTVQKRYCHKTLFLPYRIPAIALGLFGINAPSPELKYIIQFTKLQYSKNRITNIYHLQNGNSANSLIPKIPVCVVLKKVYT